MGDKLAWMTFGDDSDGDGGDVPAFLREEHAGPGDAGASPAFLSEHHTSDTTTTAAAAATATAAAAATALYADALSTEVLTFTGDSGRVWTGLRRVAVLGKGNYGCATLYSVPDGNAAAATAAGAASATPRAVVVKDINMQTMLNASEEVPALRSELHVLRSVLGHPNMVQYVDALFDTRPASYPLSLIVMEHCAGGDLAAAMEGRLPRDSAAAAATSAGSAPPPPPTSSSSSTASPVLSVSALPRPVSAATAGGGGRVRFTEPYVAAIFIQTAVALHSLHTEHGVLHRDVKPHNVFLLEDGVTVRLGDFGIATQLSHVGASATAACGSPYYMAPELFEERAYGAAADVWSLGVVLYEMIAGCLPFTASSAAELRTLVCRGRCAPLQEMVSGAAATYSRDLRGLVSSLLTTDAAARPTLRRVLRHTYVREHLRYVPVPVLTARRPRPATAEEGLYSSIFGSDVVAQAVSRAAHPGV